MLLLADKMTRLLWTVETVSNLQLTLLFLSLQSGAVSGVQQMISNPRIVEHPADAYVARNEPATLNCRAEGDPPPVIAWYKDGHPVTATGDGRVIVLPDGQLFILRAVTRSKSGETDVGVYHCVATNTETNGSVVSRNASLRVSVMRDEFREEPRSVAVGVGMTAVLHCVPPRGEPEPRIRWLKDDLVVQPGDRVTVDDQGSLRIREAEKEDSGSYVCMAYNAGGEKESAPAELSVREKPVIVEVPRDTTVHENSDVVLQCRGTSGDPADTAVIWKKLEGQVPYERTEILDDRSLKILNAQVTDDGIYVCRLENPFGWQEARARITVLSQPSFIATPRDKVVGAGRRVVIRCEVVGNPPPTVFWSKAPSQTFFANGNNGRFRILEGSLVIENVQREDAGEYTCQGVNTAGSAAAKARLEVRDGDMRPPPIIYQGPENQTLPITGTATLSCLATGDPSPSTYWMKNGVVLSLKDSRLNIRESGSLEISELRRSDTGLYTCKAVSETGETAWSAALVVESTDDPLIVFHRTPEPSTFPGAPARPQVGDVADTSVRLGWKASANQGASPVHSFSVEYFSHDTGEGWIMASDEIREQTYVVRNLQPNTSYLFLVRARNSHGLSLPSPVTSPVKTKGDFLSHPPRPTPPSIDPSVVAEKLSGQTVTMLPAEVLSSTTVVLKWELRRNIVRAVEGFHIKYRVSPDSSSSSAESGGADRGPEYVVRTVQSPTVVTYVLGGLQKYTRYEVTVLPYHGTFEGTESNAVQFRTLEDVPSAAPKNIRASVLENNTLVVSWEPPAKQFRNGILKGYRIYIQGNESKFDKIVDVNVSIETVHVRNLIKDMSYHIQMAAYNRMGESVKSELIRFGRSASETGEPLYDQQWFRIALIVIFGVILWIVFCVLSICIYRKRRALRNSEEKSGIQKVEDIRSFQKSGEQSSHSPLLAVKRKETSGTPETTGQPCMATCFYENESPSNEDLKANGSPFCGHTYQTLETVQNRENLFHCDYDASMQGSIAGGMTSMALPYATATLVSGAPNRAYPGHANIPNPQAYMIYPTSDCARQATSVSTSKTGSSNSNFGGSECQMAASGSESCHRTNHKCHQTHHHVPHYDAVNYNQSNSSEDCQRHIENYQLCSNDPYAATEQLQSRCFTPASASTDSDLRDCSQTAWPNTTDNDSDGSVVSSCGADVESFVANAASAATKTAELSGLSAVGSTVSPMVPNGQKVRKSCHRANRSESPFSADGSCSAVPQMPKPAVKSDRMKPIGEQHGLVLGGILQPNNRLRSQADDIPLKKTTAPYLSASNTRAQPQMNAV